MWGRRTEAWICTGGRTHLPPGRARTEDLVHCLLDAGEDHPVDGAVTHNERQFDLHVWNGREGVAEAVRGRLLICGGGVSIGLAGKTTHRRKGNCIAYFLPRGTR